MRTKNEVNIKPLWSVTTWDKKFNGVKKEWQKNTIKYKYLLSDKLDSIKVKNGNVRILYTGKEIAYTNETLAGDAIKDGEIVAIPWGGIPTVKYYKGKFVTGDNRIATSNDTDLLDNKYLYYFLVSKLDTLSTFYRGASLKHPSMVDVLKMKINIPEIDKQHNVCAVLDRIESLIINKENQLLMLSELVKSQFIEMFKNYDSYKTLGELSNICRGASPRPISNFITKGDGENWIKIGDVGENDIYITKTAEKVTKAGADKSRRVKTGDFILSNSMSFGRPYILGINGCVHDGWLIIADYQEHFEPLFLYHLLRSDYVQSQFDGSANGACVRNLNSDLVKKVKVITPSITIQRDFVEFAKQIDKSKFIVQKQIEDLQELLDSKMQEYFGQEEEE